MGIPAEYQTFTLDVSADRRETKKNFPPPASPSLFTKCISENVTFFNCKENHNSYHISPVSSNYSDHLPEAEISPLCSLSLLKN